MPSNLPIDGETVSVDFLDLAEAGFDALDLGGERLSERNGAVRSEARPHDGLAERAAVSPEAASSEPRRFTRIGAPKSCVRATVVLRSAPIASARVTFQNLLAPMRRVRRISTTPKWASAEGPSPRPG